VFGLSTFRATGTAAGVVSGARTATLIMPSATARTNTEPKTL
jgi:hypothetical protein